MCFRYFFGSKNLKCFPEYSGQKNMLRQFMPLPVLALAYLCEHISRYFLLFRHLLLHWNFSTQNGSDSYGLTKAHSLWVKAGRKRYYITPNPCLTRSADVSLVALLCSREWLANFTRHTNWAAAAQKRGHKSIKTITRTNDVHENSPVAARTHLSVIQSQRKVPAGLRHRHSVTTTSCVTPRRARTHLAEADDGRTGSQIMYF